jgi:two-component system, OmpR family, catabolic regulation response regulator CreB
MTERLRILIVEDEPAIADTLLYALKTEGFAPEWCATGRAGLAALAENDFALVVLDVGLPDGTGFEVCKAIRARSGVPVLFLSARNTELDRVLGLELGGDDYLVKPFSPRELTARVKAILRRTENRVTATPRTTPIPPPASPASPASETCNPIGYNPEKSADSSSEMGSVPRNLSGYKPRKQAAEIVVDEARCTITCRGIRLDLTRYEFRLLKTLAAQPGRVFSRDQLMAAAWEDPGSALDRTVDAHIKTLRAKLRAAGPDSEPIQTHRGMGYSLRTEG